MNKIETGLRLRVILEQGGRLRWGTTVTVDRYPVGSSDIDDIVEQVVPYYFKKFIDRVEVFPVIGQAPYGIRAKMVVKCKQFKNL